MSKTFLIHLQYSNIKYNINFIRVFLFLFLQLPIDHCESTKYILKIKENTNKWFRNLKKKCFIKNCVFNTLKLLK